MEICQPDACVCVHDIETENVTYRDILTYLTEYKGLKQTRAMEVSIEPILFEEDTVMYLINYEEGWELISADKRAPLHISRSDYGHMNIDKLYDNPGKKIYLNSIASKIYSSEAIFSTPIQVHTSAAIVIGSVITRSSGDNTDHNDTYVLSSV